MPNRGKPGFFTGLIILGLLMGICRTSPAQANPDAVMRVSPHYAHQAVSKGALLVCAYPDREVCDKVMLQGAVSLKELEARLPGLNKDQEIIFY